MERLIVLVLAEEDVVALVVEPLEVAASRRDERGAQQEADVVDVGLVAQEQLPRTMMGLRRGNSKGELSQSREKSSSREPPVITIVVVVIIIVIIIVITIILITLLILLILLVLLITIILIIIITIIVISISIIIEVRILVPFPLCPCPARPDWEVGGGGDRVHLASRECGLGADVPSTHKLDGAVREPPDRLDADHLELRLGREELLSGGGLGLAAAGGPARAAPGAHPAPLRVH